MSRPPQTRITELQAQAITRLDPTPNTDGTCLVCPKPRKPERSKAYAGRTAELDPFCSCECARVWYANPIPERSIWVAPPPGRRMTAAVPVVWRRERLTGTVIKGVVHARYRTATYTLCGIEAPVHEPNHWLPDCGVCSMVARRHDRVDGSMPDHWRAA